MPAAPASCCCSTRRCTSSTASRCPSPTTSTGPTAEQLAAVAHRAIGGDGELDVSELRYEVMYFLDLDDDRDRRRSSSGWGAIGDSIVVVGGDGLWNCHVHTNDIGAAIEVALDLGGRPKQIRVTDLFEEVADEHAHREAAMTGGASPSPARRTGLPPVTLRGRRGRAAATGSSSCSAQLGVQGVVTGGQTLNPSTAELLAAVEAVNARRR